MKRQTAKQGGKAMNGAIYLDRISAFERIQRTIRDKYGNQRNTAEALGMSGGYLSDMLNARRELSSELLNACGLRRRVVYEVLEDKE